MENTNTVGSLTRKNWILDAGLFLSVLVASLSGIYFLFFPDGGYKGGRNPYYGIRIIFERAGWEWIHTWISLGAVALVLIHLLFHWKWVANTTKRIVLGVVKGKPFMNPAGRKNVLVDGVLALGFFICAASGVYLWLVPEVKGSLGVDPMILFGRTTWDLLHTWSGVVFIGSGIIHFVIHWGWVTKVTRKIFVKRQKLVFEQVPVK